ncbi:MAG: universal stress protein [Pirellulales bacterium]|nr:universal stress protein [Pirellulales bacterium]
MLKSILLVVDGRFTKHASIGLAIRWAREADATLAALGIIDEAKVYTREAVPLGGGQAKREADAIRLETQRAKIEACLVEIGVQCRREQVWFTTRTTLGEPADEVALEAQRYDLLVLPHDLSRPDTNVPAEEGLGPELWKLLHQAPRPVVTVADEEPVGQAILIAYDGSLQAARALQLFVATGWGTNRAVHVVSYADDAQAAAECGQRAVDFLQHHDIAATLHADAGRGDIGDRLIEQAKTLQAGMIVMGACGRSRAQEFWLGSVTRRLLDQCGLPLFLYH